MILYVNSRKEIKDVNDTSDTNLSPIEVDDNVFAGWSIAKICCYKAILKGGKFVGFTPYVSSKIIEHIDKLATQTEQNTSDVVDTQVAVVEAYEQGIANADSITEIELALVEIYETMMS